MLKLIIFIVAAYAVYRLFVNDLLKKRKKASEEEQRQTDEGIAAGDMVQDPECGAYVSVEDSISVRDGERVYHFCSYDCRDKFLKRLETGGNVINAKKDE